MTAVPPVLPDAPTMALPATLTGVLADMGLACVGIGSADPRARATGLWPEEAAAMAEARPARRSEFAAGRRAARQAMAALGRPPAPVPMGRDRAPVWPAGLGGSISHGGNACLALVAPRAACPVLGLDIEPDAPLPEGLAPLITLPAEARWLAAQPAARRDRLARMLFSAKECAYKAQYPLSRRLLDFDAIEIRPDPSAGRFAAIFLHDAAPFRAGDLLPGRVVQAAGLTVTLIALPAADCPPPWQEAACA